MYRNVRFEQVRLEEGFWSDVCRRNEDVSIPAVRKRFEDTRFTAMRFEYSADKEKPHIYYDSDSAKWIEAVAYLLKLDRARYAEEEAFCDRLIEAFVANRRADGYMNSYFLQIEPEGVFKNRDNHELYCLGHMIEAAIAYADATAKTTLLDAVEKYCALVYEIFVEKGTAAFTTPGHEEIELALFRLYEYTKKEEYAKLARFFIDMRGANDKDPVLNDRLNGRFTQDNAPVRELCRAEGHAVRAIYLSAAMADYARICGDEEMKRAALRLFDDILTRMYVTGGIGSTRLGESFTVPFDLPNLTAYSETCAAIGLALFALRLQQLEPDGRYGDIVERVMYNGILSGVSLDGKSFFYENPLEIFRKDRDKETCIAEEHRTVLPCSRRQELFFCSCCPPNLNRFFASLGNVVFTSSEQAKTLYVNQYIACRLEDGGGTFSLQSDVPHGGTVRLSGHNSTYASVALRIPSWADGYEVFVNDRPVALTVSRGFAVVSVGSDFTVRLELRFAPVFMECHPSVRDNAGRVCLMVGPVVYCLEEADNGSALYSLCVDKSAALTPSFSPQYGMNVYQCDGYRKTASASTLYAHSFPMEQVRLIFIPYFAFANRVDCDMLVWLPYRK